MAEPRPLFTLLMAEGLALLALAGWWCGLSPADRLGRLGRVMVVEHIATVPPRTPWRQAQWLSAHRLARLEGMLGLSVVALLVGTGEGIARRGQDVYGGFLLKWWTMGALGLTLLPGLIGGYLLAPWPLPALWVACGLALLAMFVAYALACGRPYIS